MKYFLFAKTSSSWQYLVTTSAIGAAALMGFTGWSLFVALGIIIVGASVEAVIEYMDKKEPRHDA